MQNDREEPLISELGEDELDTAYAARATGETGKGRSRSTVLLLLLSLLVIGGVAYFLLGGGFTPPPEPVPAPPPAVEPPPVPGPVVESAPDIPVVAPEPVVPAEPSVEEQPEPEQPPLTLDDSDPPVKASLAAAGSAPLYTALLANTDLLRRGAGVIDGMSRGLVLHKILPLPRPTGKFATMELSGQTVLDPAGYQRYDSYAQAISSLDMRRLAATFHQFRPLLEEAYAELGYEGEDFDNRLIRSLDQVLATPELRGEIALQKKEAVYLFADPELEALSPLQKQLLRMGPENTALVKAQAEVLRKGLLNPTGF